MSGLPDNRAVSISTAGYEDGLGRRSVRFDRELGGMLECLQLRPELWAFESSLRERADAIALIDDERFVRVRTIERGPKGLEVVSELIAGQRLSDIIEARQRDNSPTFGIDAALGFLLQVVPALSTLHSLSFAHGCLAPGRILVTTASQVVLLDGIYGAALERLNLSRSAMWTSLGILAPPFAGAPRFDPQSDVIQATFCALMLAVGRPLESAGDPASLGPLVIELRELAEIRANRVFGARVQEFFASALPLNRRLPTLSAEDAAFEIQELAEMIGDEGCHAAFTRLARFEAPAVTPAREEDLEGDRSRKKKSQPAAAASPAPAAPAAGNSKAVPPVKKATSPLPSTADDPVTPAPAPQVRQDQVPVDVPPMPPRSAPAPAPAATAGISTPPPLSTPSVDPLPVPAAKAPAPGSGDVRQPDLPAPVFAPHPVVPIPPAPQITSAPPIQVAASIPIAPPPPVLPGPIPVPPAPPVHVPVPVPVAAAPPIYAAPPVPFAPVPPVLPPRVVPPIGFAPPTAPPLVPSAPVTQSAEPISIAAPTAVRVRTEPRAGYAPARRDVPPPVRAPFAEPAIQEPRRFPRKLVGAAAIVLAVGIAAGRTYLQGPTEPAARPATDRTPEPVAAATPAARNKGSLAIDTQPSGARISLDGKNVGVTPLKLDNVTPGRHTIVVATDSATVRRTVRVEAGRQLALDIPLFSGWVVVFSPIPLDIAAGGTTLGNTETGKIILPPGRHVLTLTNREFGFSETREVEIHPGEERPLNVEPKGVVNVNVYPWAEVWIDGKKAGETPIANLPVLLGTRVFVFKHPQYGERRLTTTVTSTPTLLTIDLTKP